MALSRRTPVQILQTRLPSTLSLTCHFLVELRSRFRKPCFAASERAWCQLVFFSPQICGVGALASLAFSSCGKFVFQKKILFRILLFLIKIFATFLHILQASSHDKKNKNKIFFHCWSIAMHGESSSGGGNRDFYFLFKRFFLKKSLTLSPTNTYHNSWHGTISNIFCKSTKQQ
jgi:hypothetical protein